MPLRKATRSADTRRRRPAGLPLRRAVSGPGRSGAGSGGFRVAAGARQARYFQGGLTVGRPAGVSLEALKG